MVRDDDDHIRPPDGGQQIRGGDHRFTGVGDERGDVGVVVFDERSPGLEQTDDIQGGGFAQIIDIGLVGSTQDEAAGAIEQLPAGIERLENAGDDIAGHVGVDVGGELDEMGGVLVGFHLPGKVERVDGDAVPAQAGTGGELHEAEGLAGGGIDHLPDIHAHAVAHNGKLVDHGDVDHAEGVLKQLGHLGCLGGGDGVDVLKGSAVPGGGDLGAGGGDASHDLGGVAGGVIGATGVDALGGEGEEPILADLETVGFAQPGKEDLAGGAGVGGGFEDDDHAGMHILCQFIGGGENEGHVRVAGLAERGGDADGDGIHFLQDGEICAGSELTGLHQGQQPLGGDIGDVAFPCLQGSHLARVGVDAGDLETGFGEYDRQGQTDIAHAKDGNACLPGGEFLL